LTPFLAQAQAQAQAQYNARIHNNNNNTKRLDLVGGSHPISFLSFFLSFFPPSHSRAHFLPAINIPQDPRRCNSLGINSQATREAII
jgi:hypothetical protein